MRAKLGVVGLVAISAACTAHNIDLGDGTAGVHASDAGARPDAEPASAPTPREIVTCGDLAQMSATLGNGYSDVRPAACDAPRGAAQTVSSAADLASQLVGLWSDCQQKSFGIQVAANGDEHAIQLTSDGHYVAYGVDASSTLVPLGSLPNPVPRLVPGSTDALPAATGTYTVVDGSATYGPGTYSLQLHPDDGGLFEGQVIITSAPVQLHFLATNAEEEVFTPALPWSPREGVCSCVHVSEVPEFENDANDLANAVVGRWIWCDGPGLVEGDIGVEFTAAGAWYGLSEDGHGNVTRSLATRQHGTFSVVSSTASQLIPPSTEPLKMYLKDESGASLTPFVYFSDPRVLFFGGLLTTGDAGEPSLNYGIFFPMR